MLALTVAHGAAFFGSKPKPVAPAKAAPKAAPKPSFSMFGSKKPVAPAAPPAPVKSELAPLPQWAADFVRQRDGGL